MMSGRGLDHTGGTLDKLESIPGYRVAMSSGEFKEALRTVGVAIISTTDDMAPADKKMYALRDVTSTVQSLPLITGSIMCKKLAENPDSLVLDVKTGAGAFMVAESDAIALAKSMIATGEADGKCTTAFVTSMDQPLGRAIGNWLEVAESILTLRGEGPKDLEDLSVSLAAQMLVQAHGSGKGKESRGFHCRVDAEGRVRETMRNGEALAAFRRHLAGAHLGRTPRGLTPHLRASQDVRGPGRRRRCDRFDGELAARPGDAGAEQRRHAQDLPGALRRG